MVNRFWALIFSALIVGSVPLAGLVNAEEVSVGNAFIEAYDRKDDAAMQSIIKSRAAEVPEEVKSMVQYAVSPKASPDEQDFLFNIAGTMSQIYAKQTGDDKLLGAVQQNYNAVLEKRQGGGVSKSMEDKTKKELVEIGKGLWRVTTFKVTDEGALDVEIDVKESTDDSKNLKIAFKDGVKAKEIIQKNLPKVKSGQIRWSTGGLGFKTVMLDD